MAVIQSTYIQTMRAGLPGMVANMTTWDADTRKVETATGIGFGLAVGQGADDRGAVLGATTAAKFVGVSVRDVTLRPGDADKYPQYANIAVLTEGDIWVTAEAQVAPGDDVTFNAATGALSSAATGASQFAVAGARWMTSAATGALAILRLGGALPAA